MLNLLSNIIDIITTLITFIFNTIMSFINLISNIPTYTTFLISSINVLPVVLIPFATVSISLYVVLLIMGRN